MHELSICQGLLAQVAEVARSHPARRATRLVVGVGPLAGVEPGLLARAFSVARAGTVAERATLEFEQLPVRVRCRECGNEAHARANRLLCAACGTWRTELISGDELLLMRVELEDE